MKKYSTDDMIPFTSKKRARKKAATGAAAGVVAGAAIGAAVGILFAPKTGKETRQDIKDKAEEYSGIVADKTKTAYKAVKDKLCKCECDECAEDASEDAPEV